MNQSTGEINVTASVYKSEEGRRLVLERYDELLLTSGVEYVEQYVPTTYGETYILESGAKDLPPLFLFHGTAVNSTSWFADMKELTQHFRVFVVDLIGEAGHSAQTRPPMKANDYANWVKEIFAGLGIEKASVMGNSLGGWVCLKFASVFPEKVDKVVLLATAGIVPVSSLFTVRLILNSLRGYKGAEMIRQLVFGKGELSRELQEMLAYMNLITGYYVPNTEQIPVLSDEEIRRLSMPILYLAGENDQIFHSVRCAKRLKKMLPKSKSIILKNTGHIVFHVLDRVIPFLIG